MKEALKHTIAGLQLFLIAAMFSTSFMATQGYFNDLVTFKQYGLEIISLYVSFVFVITLFFQKLHLNGCASTPFCCLVSNK